MALEKKKRRLIFSWASAKGLIAILLHLVTAFSLEQIVIFAFSSYGLTDNMLLTSSFKFPGTDFIFTLSISPVFHLMPLGVVITLLSSWMHLTRVMAEAPPETAKIQRKEPKRRSGMPKRVRFKQAMRIRSSLTRFLSRSALGIRRVSSAVKGSLGWLGNMLRINRVSSFFRRSHFARAAITGSSAILSLFIFLVFAMHLAWCPTFLKGLVFQFYQDNPYFQMFILGIYAAVQLFAQFLSYLGLSTAFLQSFIAPLAKATIEMDVLLKYLISQNVAAWVPALLVLLYGRFKR